MTVVYPQVNINGTTGRELLEQHLEAREAVHQAYKSLQKAMPHGRDYQTVGEERYRLARQQFNVWFVQLDDMAKSLEEIAWEISAQIPEGKR